MMQKWGGDSTKKLQSRLNMVECQKKMPGRWTLNPAKLMHLDDRLGSLKKGKDADIVIWTSNPLSIEARVSKTFVDGELLYDESKSVDHYLRIQQEKARIISKMLASNKAGEAKKPFIKKKEKHWHCDTIGDSID